MTKMYFLLLEQSRMFRKFGKLVGYAPTSSWRRLCQCGNSYDWGMACEFRPGVEFVRRGNECDNCNCYRAKVSDPCGMLPVMISAFVFAAGGRDMRHMTAGE